ncbi:MULTISPECIES: hypothetical protein [unclassified Dysgonomonas]|uniref:type IX secretion system periplasmic lipoprotein PorW/SprE n=1 Tax=unclassified Dysgonomonas TaxID=2630389 RepID=UPI0024743BC2|nr:MULTISPECIES: hypothetical protein [unclassified Dysgonomonas]
MHIRKQYTAWAVTIILALFFVSCSTKKNTSVTRAYHSINTRYNIYFNAEQAYEDALKNKLNGSQDNLSDILSVYPYNPELDENKKVGGPFDITIDKCTKAIKLHSIKAKPQRDPDKRKNQKYQQWLKQREFNPFLKNAWLLMGKAEYQNEDYMQAVTTFTYITHLYNQNEEILAEARLWTALSYTQMGWFYEAENILQKIQAAGGVPKNLRKEFSSIYANYLVRNKEYEAAIPYVEQAIKHESNKQQKIRLRYLLGQLYAKNDEGQKAYKAFDKVHGMSTPYLYSFNATMHQSEFYDAKNRDKVLSKLNGMAKSSKNKEYLDQVYYAIGNIWLNEGDTVKAIENYKLAAEKSTRNGFDKAISQLKLGDIYFDRHDFLKAQPCYSDVVNLLTKRHELYPRAAQRSEVLDGLVVHAQAQHDQDSIQYLAKLPEAERLDTINRYIERLKKEDKEQEEEARRLAREEGRDNADTPESMFDRNQQTPNQQQTPTFGNSNQSSFYFYNPQAVSQGKVTFQRQWGTRKLEDNWRRKDKTEPIFGDEQQDLLADDGEQKEGDNPTEKTGDEEKPEVDEKAQRYSAEYYISQLPLTPEALKESDDIIDNALFNMGIIYREGLSDPYLAIETFDTDLRRFPETPNTEEIYYQLFLIYMQLGDRTNMELYRSRLLAQFPEKSYAKTLSDPNYEWNMANMLSLQDSLYDATYDSYLNSRVNTVRENYTYVKEKYPLSKLMPKFMFLNALTYAQTNNVNEFRSGLKELVEKYPQEDVSEVATGMLKNLANGRTLAADGSMTKGMIWDIAFGDDLDNLDLDSVQFTVDDQARYLLLFIYDPLKVDKNKLIYDVAAYNFSKFVSKTFDLAFTNVHSLEMLQVKEFNSLSDIKEYVDMAFEKNSLVSKLDSTIVLVPISVDNYASLMKGKTLNSYFEFFAKNYNTSMGKVISYWNMQIEEETERAQQEEMERILAEKEKYLKDVLEEPKKVEEKEDILAEEKVTQPETKPDGVATDTTTTVEPKPAEGVDIEKKDDGTTELKTEVSAADLFDDDQIETIDNTVNTIQQIVKNPVDGLKNLFSKDNDKPKLTKEEKQQLKEEKAARKAAEKAIKQAEKHRQDSIQKIEKAAQDLIEQQAREKEDAEKFRQDSIKNVAKAAKKAKEDAQKQKVQERKDKEKERKERLKEKERERKERQKAREAELKQKERERKERLKQKEEERKERLRQKEQERRERERQKRK